MRIRILGLFLLSILCLGADPKCDSGSADNRQERATKKMALEAEKVVGMPDITNWTERKFAKDILELRDEAIATYTYIVDMHGKFHFVGESIGYGLPYSVQFTNPMRYEINGATLPQPDPNGLFMPDGLSATWILLKDPDSGEVRPVYVEPQIFVSPFRLRHLEGS